MNIHISDSVQSALRVHRPVVALETAVVTHGMPFPRNLEVARRMEAIVRDAGAIPATIGILAGQVVVGVDGDQLERLAKGANARKVSVRDIAVCALTGQDGGTTVAATAYLAHRAGIRVFVTGGIGGVHRGHPFDVSADLPVLAETPIAVACSGAKSLLDLPLTLEWLETHGVPVVGYQTGELPAFFHRESGLPVDFRAESVDEIARLAATHWGVGMQSAVLVGVPVPAEQALDGAEMEAAIASALADAEREGVRGKAVTPYLLQKVAALTGERSLHANEALLAHNAEVGARLAVALSQLDKDGQG